MSPAPPTLHLAAPHLATLHGPDLVLASASSARRRLLADVGVPVIIDPADVDEGAVKLELLGRGAGPGAVAMALAELKALTVAARHPGALVIGCDQVLAAGDRLFDKPADMAAARAHLLALRGRPHMLISAVAVACDGVILWRHDEAAHLSMRDFSDAFLDAYLAVAGPAVLGSVGAYALEGTGAQLFERIAGDHFTIQGLPLLALLDFLRGAGACLA